MYIFKECVCISSSDVVIDLQGDYNSFLTLSTKEVLLQENGNYVERTIDVILVMESDLDPTIQRY